MFFLHLKKKAKEYLNFATNLPMVCLLILEMNKSAKPRPV